MRGRRREREEEGGKEGGGDTHVVNSNSALEC